MGWTDGLLKPTEWVVTGRNGDVTAIVRRFDFVYPDPRVGTWYQASTTRGELIGRHRDDFDAAARDAWEWSLAFDSWQHRRAASRLDPMAPPPAPELLEAFRASRPTNTTEAHHR